MAEPSKDRDKAVEEALAKLVRGHEWRATVLDWLWQRAQEAEREENCKAVCEYCQEGKYEPAVLDAIGNWWHRAGDRLGPACKAHALRNRAARASEEPKP